MLFRSVSQSRYLSVSQITFNTMEEPEHLDRVLPVDLEDIIQVYPKARAEEEVQEGLGEIEMVELAESGDCHCLQA